MDPKEIKALIKQARSAYQGNDHNAALKNCKVVLKYEPDNYTINIIMGASLSHLGKHQQCVEAYRHAIKVHPDQLPAWQGLVQHYEKTENRSHPDLIEAYKKIAAHYEKNPEDANNTKYIENTRKFAGVLVSQGEFQKGLKVLLRLSKQVQITTQVATLIVQIISNLKVNQLSADEADLHLQALDILTKNPETAKDEYFKTYYSLLYKADKMDKLIDECLAVGALFNSVSYPMEYLCRLYVETHSEVLYSSEISLIADKLFKLNPSNLYGYYAKGKFYFEAEKYNESMHWLKEGLGYKFNVDAAQVLIQAKLKYGDFSGALETVEECKKKGKELNQEALLRLRVFEFEALLGSSNSSLQLAEKKLKEWEGEEKDEDLVGIIGKLNAKLCVWKLDWKTLAEILPSIQDSDSVLNFYKILGSVEDNENIDETIVDFFEKETSDIDLIILSGLTLWKLNKFTHAVTVLNKLVRPNRYHPLPLIYLGKLHRMAGDLQAAIKHLEMAYELYPSNEAGSFLSDVYFEEGSEVLKEKNKELLTSATKRLKKSNSKWAWLRLGLLYLQNGEANEAAVALQSAVRTDYNDAYLWETLADTYFARGSYQSALRSYNKALELNADPIYPTYKIGIVYQQLNDHKKAIETFERLLSQDDTYNPAILELSKTHYYVAQRYIADKRDTAGVQAIEACVRWAMRSLELENKVLPWKLIGDCSILLEDLPTSTIIKIPSSLLGPDSGEGSEAVDLLQFLRTSTDCLHMALKTYKAAGLTIAQSELYHDLGYSYRLRAMRTSDSATQSELLSKALAALKIAVSKKKTSYIYWNTLGVVASHPVLKLGSLAQHAFIKSLQLEPNNVVAWCNLGLLHFHSRSYINAHHCFSKAQTIDPSYSFCWVGQCIVAEEIKPFDAIDLYRHACLLDNYPSVAILGYTDWVCRLLATGDDKEENYVYSIIKCEAVRTSFDLISYYCVRRPDDVYGFVYRGLLAGRLGLLRTAKECFECSLEMINEDLLEITDIIKCNLAATLLNIGEVDKAFECLKEIKTLDFTVCCVAAEAFYTVGNYPDSIDAYQQAVERATVDDLKAEAYIGLGIVHGKYSGLEIAKTHIFQGWRIARQKITGLLAIVALSLQKEELTNADSVIAGAVYDEIKPIADYDLLNDVATISSAWHIAQGDMLGAKNCILRAAHRYPWNPALWNTLAHYLIECHEKDVLVRPLIRKAVSRANVWERTSEQLTALSYLLEDNTTLGLLYAKKAVHSEPHVPTTWAILIWAFYRKMRNNRQDSTLKYTLTVAERALRLCSDLDSPIARWLKDYIVLVSDLL